MAKEYDLQFAIDDAVFLGTVRGYSSGGKYGFLIRINEQFDAAFRVCRLLHL